MILEQNNPSVETRKLYFVVFKNLFKMMHLVLSRDVTQVILKAGTLYIGSMS